MCSDMNRISFLKTLTRSQVVRVPRSSCPSDVPVWELTCCILIARHDWEWCSLKGLPVQMAISQHPWGLRRTNIGGRHPRLVATRYQNGEGRWRRHRIWLKTSWVTMFSGVSWATLSQWQRKVFQISFCQTVVLSSDQINAVYDS